MAPEIRSHFDGADGTSSAKYLNLRKTVTNVVVIVHRIGEALRCDFLLAEKVRNANGEGSSWKSAANKTHM
jgi:hypothetical protein